MPDNKTPADPKKALVGCSMVLALLSTIAFGILWVMSSGADSQHFMFMFVIGVIITFLLGKQVEAGAKK